jgi:hypothetical protein
MAEPTGGTEDAGDTGTPISGMFDDAEPSVDTGGMFADGPPPSEGGLSVGDPDEGVLETGGDATP